MNTISDNISGVLVIDKPAGPTSHDVVSVVKRTLCAQKAGHLGTLDPRATGVLPIVINGATKLASRLAGGLKVYEFTLCLGEGTDTDDEAGRVLASKEAPPSLERDLQGLLCEFTGAIMQRPPMYSAKRVGGRRACDMARKGVEFSLEPRPVVIESLELVAGGSWPRPRLRMSCGPGTFVRSLCRDLAARLGVPGHAASIRRLASGPYIIDEALPLERLVARPALWMERLLPV